MQEHPQGAVQRQRAAPAVPDRAQDAVRRPSLPAGLLVQEMQQVISLLVVP